MIPISIQYDITPKERTEGRSILVRPNEAHRKRFWRGLFGWVLFLLLAVLFFLMMNRNRDGPTTGPRVQRPVETPAPAPIGSREHRLRLIAVAVWTGSAVVFAGVLSCSVVLVRRETRKRDSGAGPRRTTYTFTEDALVEASGAKTTQIYWPAFHSFAETQSLFVIRNDPEQGPVIPKRLFASEAEVGEVRELLVRKLTPPPVPDPPAPSPPEVP